MIVMIKTFTILAGGVVALLSAGFSASLAASSDWLAVSGGKMRLVTAASPDGATLRAGLQTLKSVFWVQKMSQTRS